ncbi:antibiotic biosynthesis monooxygenase family protein [Listeria booriae]|uniref:antibiotic biosynthesis monooxygenase family protein n=1 Tax=Listeria booriae TaxID=1552123 RepID=UPI0035E3D80F
MLRVTQGDTDSFEQDFKIASAYIASIPGYINHELHKCLENETDCLFAGKRSRPIQKASVNPMPTLSGNGCYTTIITLSPK